MTYPTINPAGTTLLHHDRPVTVCGRVGLYERSPCAEYNVHGVSAAAAGTAVSRIYFHTPERTAEVLGRERAYMGCLAGNLALGVIDPHHDDYDWLRAVSVGVPDYVFARSHDWLRTWRTWFRVGWSDGRLIVNGEEIGATELALNTLIATRSPSLTLLAKVHGMCEGHAWVAAEDAEWFDGLIDACRGENVLRPGMGWEGVAELARQVAAGVIPGPVVTSYSVCDGFPNGDVAAPYWTPDPAAVVVPDDYAEDVDFDEEMFRQDTAGDAWFDLPEDEQWDLALKGIKAREHNRQISPATMDQGFMSGASAFDLLAERDMRRSVGRRSVGS